MAEANIREQMVPAPVRLATTTVHEAANSIASRVGPIITFLESQSHGKQMTTRRLIEEWAHFDCLNMSARRPDSSNRDFSSVMCTLSGITHAALRAITPGNKEITSSLLFNVPLKLSISLTHTANPCRNCTTDFPT